MNTATMSLLLLAGMLIASLAVQAPQLSKPLLEGAAGKQTHTAMIARNLDAGRAVFTRPIIDDIGNPGYFIKEIPLIPQLAAWTHRATGLSIDASGRLLGLLAWLAASSLLYLGLARAVPAEKALLTVFWMLMAPLAFAYAPAFQNDTSAILLSLGTWTILIRWRYRPEIPTAVLAGALTAGSLLLKPHIVFWLTPAALVLVFGGGNRPAARQWLSLATCGIAGGGLASLWYLHAAEIHRAFPTPGATVANGWVDTSLLLTGFFWQELARQLGMMVFTPLGVAFALLGLGNRSPRSLIEWSLIAWGGGVVLQDLVFSTRFTDHLSHGTEYYNLALVPTAGLLISAGILELRDRAQRPRHLVLFGAIVGLGTSSILIAEEARTPPAAYASLLEDCAQVQKLSKPSDPFLVFADRSGTILYYCQRRGTTFSLGTKRRTMQAAKDLPVVGRSQLDRAVRGAEFAYFPFPEQVEDPALWSTFEAQWQELELRPSTARLFQRKDAR